MDLETETRLAALEAQIDAMIILISAHEWVLENLAASFFYREPGGLTYFEDLSKVGGRVWRAGEDFSEPPRPDTANGLAEAIARICNKIALRVVQGRGSQ